MSGAGDSETRLVQRAFGLLEDRGPSSLEDGSYQAELGCLHWPDARRATLTAVDWGFASRVVALPPLDDPGIVPSGWSRFRQPDDMIGLFAVRDDPQRLYEEGDDIAHHIEERDIVACVANTAPAEGRIANALYIRYTFDVTVTGRFTSEFVEAAIHYLAYLLAPRVSASENTAARMLRTYNGLIAEAALVQAQRQSVPSYLHPTLRTSWVETIESGLDGPSHLFAGGRWP